MISKQSIIFGKAAFLRGLEGSISKLSSANQEIALATG